MFTELRGQRKPVPELEPFRLAWIVGLFEGEGTIGLKSKTRPNLQLTSTDRDVIDRLHEWSTVGTVHAMVPTDGRKPYWVWSVSARDDAGELLEQMLPHLGERRAARARQVIAGWKSVSTRGTAPTCSYGHELAGDNLRFVDGRRRCLACQARRQREHRARQAARKAVV